ncbi:hypothetical protein B0T10DRAFT_410635 [Thelonectria olida]|uniref:Uncharacterized protein n=1 Tax=Thelonectria olida TaxID=1576542 RepID=A0A9P8VWD2_9HYPO|nr:hypothetical protein B0T10DRAFT_411052 [Thelonectria olida]KAH6883811.1 hypothetical protein B0T10DRAFT_410635 [Thelonectria olida]
MAATGCTIKPKDVSESHIQLIIQELRDMDRGLRSAVKHQQQAVEASLVEWRRSELSTNANNKKPVEETVPSK